MKKNINKRKKKVGKGFKLFALILLITSLLLLGNIIFLNVLSPILLIGIIILFVFIDSICLFLLLKSKKKKIGLLISSIFIIIFVLLTYYLNKTTEVFSNLNIDHKTYNYSIVVLKTSNHNDINDLKEKKIGFYNDFTEEGTKALERINRRIKNNNIEFDDINILKDNLINENIDAIMIEKSYLDILNENVLDNNVIFKDLIKEIYSFTIRVKIDDISKDLNVTKEPFNIYISGIDTYGEISSVSRSDVNMVVTVNPTTNQILLTSIPRDYYVSLYNKKGYKDKITHAGLYGIETSIKTVEDLLNIEINYYLKVNFSSVIDIVNAIDGVNVYSEYDFTSRDNFHYVKGYNKVNGEEALSFARERYAFAIGDRQRVKNQQALLNAMIEKCLSPSIIKNYGNLLDTVQNSFVTNIKMSRVTSLIKMQLTNNYDWNIISNSLNGTDSKNYTYSAPNTKVYVMSPVSDSINYATELIEKVEKGDILDKTTIEEEQRTITTIVNQTSNNQTTTSNKNTQEEIKIQKEPKEEQTEGLTAKLVKTNIEFTEGDEYIYHGITATHNKIDITNNSELKIIFKVNNKEFDDYRDLIYHVSNLDSGNYIINYIVSYKQETTTLNQIVTIKKQINNEEILTDQNDNIINNDNEDNNIIE